MKKSLDEAWGKAFHKAGVWEFSAGAMGPANPKRHGKAQAHPAKKR